MKITRVFHGRGSIPRNRFRSKNDGFSYVALLIFLAILAVSALGTANLESIVKRRIAEQELLRIGKEFKKAMALYAVNSPVGSSPFPKRLEDLTQDPRYERPKRYLRQVYDDPLTGSAEWGIIRSQDGAGIIGIYSRADQQPIKIDLFNEEFKSFRNASSYHQWIFTNQL